jgi:subtilisin family serine protease
MRRPPSRVPRPTNGPRRPLRVASVLSAVLVAVVAVLVAPAGPAVAQPASPPDDVVDVAVDQVVATEGSAEVIVEVRTETPTWPGTEARAVESRQVVEGAVDDDVVVLATIEPRVVVRADGGELERLRRTDRVERISLNRAHRPALTATTAAVQAPSVWGTGVQGQGQALAVFDSGVDTTHPFFAGSVLTEACFSGSSSLTVGFCPDTSGDGNPYREVAPGAAAPCVVSDPTLTSGQRSLVEAQCAHGTHVAGIAVGGPGGPSAATSGVAPAASLIAVQVFSYLPGAKSIVAMDSDLLPALDWLRVNAPASLAALNLSLGGPAVTTTCTTDVLRPAIAGLTADGVAVVAASGNEGRKNSISTPACIPESVAVGAVDTTASPWRVPSFSNSGPGLDLLAPGVAVVSSYPDGTYGLNTGTSMAAPHVAGAIALLRQARPGGTVGQYQELLQRGGLKVTDPADGRTTPTIRIAASLAGFAPLGSFDTATGGPGSIAVTGWAIDPDTVAPVPVEVRVDGQLRATVTADAVRPDVGAAFPGYGSAHGFATSVSAAAGSRQVCVTARNDASGGPSTSLGCRTVTVPSGSPFGSVDRVAPFLPGLVAVSGWAIDPDTAAPVDVHVYVDGVFAGAFPAAGSRPDVGAAFPGYGPDHGFSLIVPSLGGTRQVCTYGINVGPGTNRLIGCRAVVMPGGSPFGSLDTTIGGPGRIDVSGWVIDPDTYLPVDVHVYVDGRFAAARTADGVRPDVGRAFPFYGAAHGYGVSVPAGPGLHQVCVYGIDVGVGSNALVSCRSVTVPSGSPFGSVDGASGRVGGIDLRGWAIDPDTAAPIDVHVYVDGAFAGAFPAAGSRPDVGAAFPGYGSAHGFILTVPAAAGTRTACVYGINVGPGSNRLIACRAVGVG